MGQTPEEWVSDQMFYATGGAYRVNPERLYDGAAVVAERRKAVGAATISRVADAAIAIRRAQASADLERWSYRRQPTPANLAAFTAAQAAVTDAVEALRDACVYDDETIAAACHRYGIQR